MVPAEGVYPGDPPEATVVPPWAYFRPCDYGGRFDPRIAELEGGEFPSYVLGCIPLAYSGIPPFFRHSKEQLKC